jgi:hypothetical protein
MGEAGRARERTEEEEGGEVEGRWEIKMGTRKINRASVF